MELYQWISNQRDRVLALGVALLGFVALIVGWYGVSGKDLPAAQLPYLASGGLFGIFALGVAATLWLSADLRDEWTKLEDLDAKLELIASHLEQDLDPSKVPSLETGSRASRRTLRSAR